MIIYILVALTVLVFISWLLIKNTIVRWILGTASTLLLLIFGIAVSANLSNHWGMKKETIVSVSKPIYTAGQISSPANLLIVQELGTSSNNYVMIYRTNKNDKSPSVHFTPDKNNIVVAVKKQAIYKTAKVSTATVKKADTYWVWKSDLYKALFDVDSDDKELISETTTVTVPEDSWVVLTSAQAKKLSKLQTNKAQTATAQQQLKQLLLSKVKEYMLKHPSATQDEIKQYTQKLTTEMAVEAIKSELKQIK